jgi:hypothetical protein
LVYAILSLLKKKLKTFPKEDLIEQSGISESVNLHIFRTNHITNLISVNVYSPNTVRLKCFSFDDALFEPMQTYIPPSCGCTFEISRILLSFDRKTLDAEL